MEDGKSQFSIRQLLPDDIASVVKIEKLANPSPWTDEQFRAEVKNPCSDIDLLIINNEIAAYICSWKIVDELQIQNVATAPDFRRQGCASLLLKAVLARAVEEGVRKAILEVRIGNVAAVSLYESFGFVNDGVRHNYYSDNEDALLMALELSES